MSAGEVCGTHKTHQPRNLTVEDHHVIPQAWQQTWAPPSGRSPAGSIIGLWDPRTVPLCPTGHRNVHWWIVQLMHAAAAAGTNDPMVASARVRPKRLRSEFPVALLALTRFTDAGGQLQTLIAAREFGTA